MSVLKTGLNTYILLVLIFSKSLSYTQFASQVKLTSMHGIYIHISHEKYTLPFKYVLKEQTVRLSAFPTMLEKGSDVIKNHKEGKVIFSKNGIQELSATLEERLQIMDFRPVTKKAFTVLPELWHDRLAHVNPVSLSRTALKGAAYGLEGLKTLGDQRAKIYEQAKNVTFREDLMPILPKKKAVAETTDSDEVEKFEVTIENDLVTKENNTETAQTAVPNDHDEDTLEINASDEELFQSRPTSPRLSTTPPLTWSAEMHTEEQAPVARRLRNQETRRAPYRYQASFLTKEDIPEPANVQEAMKSKHWRYWLEGMESEMKKQHENGT
ncbi:unnamed protein product [Orchesella dallaii]|uniref:Uncharacterized protein n=1 Tax=Orchesella dallaii TaxID=48710 RepID=A0ABP1S1H7_9HEXA